MSADNSYMDVLRTDRAETLAYRTKSVVKTEQQKALEQLLKDRDLVPGSIADLACGGGALGYHLRSLYPKAHFTLGDLDPEALALAGGLNGNDGFSYVQMDLHTLSGLANDTFDLVFCWQTLMVISDAQAAVRQLIRIAKPGGRIFISSLFNLDHDLDIRSQLRDHTRTSGRQGLWVHYNTFSRRSVDEWINGLATSHELHRFTPQIDIHHHGKGLGTYTVKSDRERLQISGGLLMNWAILEIVK